MSTNYGFEPTLDGLNSIDADSSTSNNIVCDTLTVNISGTAPTMSSLDNSTNIATTAFVTSAVSTAGGSYVTLAGSQTLTTGVKTFTNLPECSVVPTTANQLCNFTYVNLVAGGSGILSLSNTFTGLTNTFNETVKVTNTSNSDLNIYNADVSPITMGGIYSTSNTFASSNTNLYSNTLAVPIGNSQPYIGVTVPIDLQAKGAAIIYAGTLTLTFTAIYQINIYKNGVFFQSVTSWDLTNFTTNTRTWTGWTEKQKDATAYMGNVNFKVPLTTGNTSIDNYYFGIAITFSTNAPSYFAAYWLCYDNGDFTQTHTTTSTGTTYTSTDPATFITYAITSGNTGAFILGTSDVSIDSFTNININSAVETNIESDGTIYNKVGTITKETITNTTTTINNATVSITGTTLSLQSPTITVSTSSSFSLIPVGTINTSVVSTVPSGFLYCDGTAVSRSTYSVLFAAISTTFGVGNGTTTFNVPNFLGAFLRGASTQTVSGIVYTASAVGTVQQDMALTTAKSGYSTPFESTGFRSCSGGTRDCLARTNQGDTPENPTGLSLAYPTGRFGTEVRPMNYSVYYYIKY